MVFLDGMEDEDSRRMSAGNWMRRASKFDLSFVSPCEFSVDCEEYL